MQFIYEILSFNRILTVSLLAWFVAQVLKTLINFILLGKFQLERMWGDGGMPSAHGVRALTLPFLQWPVWWPSSPCTTPWACGMRLASRPRS